MPFENGVSQNTTMENCQEIITTTPKITTTKFMRGGICVAIRTIKTNRNHTKERWYNAAGELNRDGAPAEIHYRKGIIQYCSWYRNGKKHRDDDEPAEILYYRNGQISTQWWYINGKLERINCELPTEIQYCDGFDELVWYKDDQSYRETGPAIIKRDSETGEVIGEYWYKGGDYHRDGGPAVIEILNNKETEYRWYKDGKLYRDGDLPSVEAYKDGKVTYQSWETENGFHRETGPALIFGNCIKWALNGQILKYEDVPDAIRFPPNFRDAMRCLPLPISQAIMDHCEWKWQ